MQVGQPVKTIDGKEGILKATRPDGGYVECGTAPGQWYLWWQIQFRGGKCPKCGKTFDLTPEPGKRKYRCVQCEAPLKSDIFTICDKCWAIEKQALREKFVFKSEPEERDWFVIALRPHSSYSWGLGREELMTKSHALKVQGEFDPTERRAFKWSQGITG